MDSTLVNIALPTMMVDLNVSASSSVLIINASQIAMLVSLLPFSALGALVGYRRVYLAGMMVFSIACVGCALSQTLEQIVVARLPGHRRWRRQRAACDGAPHLPGALWAAAQIT
jgi:DHA2 family multidrug resistance protein-like MFS transporter